jgi:hypothetical protein
LALWNRAESDDSGCMSDPQSAAPTLAQHLLSNGIPPTLLIDLIDPVGMKIALASELTESDVALAPAPTVVVRQARSISA